MVLRALVPGKFVPAWRLHRCVNGSYMNIIGDGGRWRLAHLLAFCVQQGCSWSTLGPWQIQSMPSVTNSAFIIISVPHACAFNLMITPYVKSHQGKWGYESKKNWLCEVTEFGKFKSLVCSFLKRCLFCTWFLHHISLSSPLLSCCPISDKLHCLLSWAASWKLAVTQGSCFLGLSFGTALNFHCTFQSLFSLRNRFVIQGVQCDRVLLGRFSENKPAKWPHSLQCVQNVWACMEVLQKGEKSVFMVWLCC